MIVVAVCVVIAHLLVLLGLLRMPLPGLPEISIPPSMEAVLLPPPTPPAPAPRPGRAPCPRPSRRRSRNPRRPSPRRRRTWPRRHLARPAP
ncbi:hypothetical protein [Cupriavidus campinensis]|uniref:hypothetical protein n=1 Tax=Cupriavidus campinensis TaxID=151783 RepID=UPI0021CCB693|nr:hypothetical protein [Cupriavidus campinensis]